MAGSALLAALFISCTLLTGAVEADARQNGHYAEISQEAESYMPILCSPLPPPSSPSSSVDTVTPAEITAVHTLGAPLSLRTETSRVVSRLAELVSMFNPDVVVGSQTSSQPRSLQEEAQALSRSLSHRETDWKLVLIIIPADLTCICSPHVVADVNIVVQEVEAALQILHDQLHRTFVHMVVWGGHHEQDKCECKRDDKINLGLYKAAFLKTLQDSLSKVAEDPKWHGRTEDFTVLLQSAPVITEPNSDPEDSLSDLNRAAVQLWTNLLQPSAGQVKAVDGRVVTFPCPTQERPFLRTQRNSPSEKEIDPEAETSDHALGIVIPCTERNPSAATPTSVHKLRPADIKVVAAVGDSLTAANGVGANPDNLLQVITQYRGLSWSIGGDENITTVTTLPNILREFNPSLTGFSEGTGGHTEPKSFLNQAVPGAKSGDMVEQVRALVDIMKTDSRIDFNNDWKVITMFIGGNDICDFCMDSVNLSPYNVVNNIRQALDILHSEVPRAIVNLVELLNIVPLRGLHLDSSLECPTWLVGLICPCIVKPKEGSAELEKVHEFNRAYQRGMRDLIDTGNYDTRDNFTVVLQPFFREVFLPLLENGQPDRSYFTPDCFHLSQKAHTLMAQALWNNMLEPVGHKTFTQDFTAGLDLKCPTETDPYFKTAVNSNYTYPDTSPTVPSLTNWGSDFSCVETAPSSSVPTSADRVRPADIKVIGALGDSLTAAFGARATNVLELRTEFRGVSWSIGGDETLETVTTLPNILKKFNPDLKGPSLGEGKTHLGFNMAISGAKIAGIPGQVRTLIDTMKNNSAVDFHNDWKLVTLFIGGNDLCQYCNDRLTLSAKNYSLHMQKSLDLLYEEVPRVIVNVVEILEIEGLRKIKRDSLGCNVIQPFVCPCFLSPGDESPELAEIKRINRQLQDDTQELVYSGRYDGREDFAVVLQPFFRNTVVPVNAEGRPDTDYFSEDCFHFSERGQSDMASALWNNMLEPVGEKQRYNHFRNDRSGLKCPTKEHPYIFTRRNSFTSSTPTPMPPDFTLPPQTSAKPCITECSEPLPIWVSPVVAVAGLLVGCGLSAIFFVCRAKKQKKKTKTMPNSAF
ncbi:phospholipase B1, membrane-associated-like [Salarias fasciatus]|uniref:phospholipase B1, membrane-associated-like n=1 Tax=Salarias fasciatus TaxID=181472 RepID=UPI001176DA91|nr:phospholipase B1, membrane-associated-like [Salarias fasciatus]